MKKLICKLIGHKWQHEPMPNISKVTAIASDGKDYGDRWEFVAGKHCTRCREIHNSYLRYKGKEDGKSLTFRRIIGYGAK